MKTKHITLLILRIIVGGMMAFAGIMKLLDMGMTTQYFASMGLSAPIAWLVSIGETLAGLGILFGVFTQIAAAAIAIIMAGAVYYTSIYATSTEVTTTSIFLVLSLILMYTGSGKYAIKPCACSVKDVNPTPATSTSVTPPPTSPTNPTAL